MIVQYYVKSFARQAADPPQHHLRQCFFWYNSPMTASFSMFEKQDFIFDS